MSEEEPARRGPRGGVGAEIFDQVERLVSEEGLNRTQAFQRLSEETGRRAGTVAANYYRIARQRGAELRPRAPRVEGGRGRGRGRGRSTSAPGDADAVVQRAMDAIKELGDLVRRQDKELQSLREQSEQLTKMRTWMERNMN